MNIFRVYTKVPFQSAVVDKSKVCRFFVITVQRMRNLNNLTLQTPTSFFTSEKFYKNPYLST